MQVLSMSLKSTFRALQYKNYRLFFIGQGTSLIGTWMQRVATSWLVYRLTGSAVLLGVVGFVSQIPTLFFSPIGGVIADKLDRRKILLYTQILSMVQAFILAVLVVRGTVTVYWILILNSTLGLVNAFDITARQSFVVEMIDNKEDLSNAIALNSSLVNGARLIGPSVTGIIIAAAGEGVCYFINCASYLIIIIALFKMKIRRREKAVKDTRVIQDFREGFIYISKTVPMRSTIVLLALVSLMGMPYQVLMPLFAKEVLGGGAHTLGFLMGATGLGALAGTIYLASRKNTGDIPALIPSSAAVFGAGLIAFSFSKTEWLSLPVLLIAGFGMMLQMSSSNTLLQVLVDDDKRGRVMAFYTMAFMGMVPLGSLLGGGLAGIIGAPYTVLAGGILCIAGSFFLSEDIRLAEKMPAVTGKVITPEIEMAGEASEEIAEPL